MTNLILATALAMSPKVASHMAQPVNVPLVVQPITVTVGWRNRPDPMLASNELAIMPLAGGVKTYVSFPATNRAQVTAPSNTVVIAIAAIGIDGSVLPSVFSNPVTNQVPLPPPPLTNVQYVIPMFSADLVTWTKQTNMAWPWTQPGYWRLLTSTNL